MLSFPRPNNTSNDSYSDNDKQGESDNDDSFLGGIKWSLFFLDKRRIGSFLSLNRSLNEFNLIFGSNKISKLLW